MEELDAASFDAGVGNGRAMVDFWAPWCGPCRALAPVIEQIAQEVGDGAVVAKVNIEESPELAEKFGVQSIPTLIFFKNGAECGRMVGMATKADILANLNG
jgi:thioredoxin 1